MIAIIFLAFDLEFKSQKLLFLDTAEGVSTALRPYWSDATRGRASVVQALPDMLEIVPSGTSKGSGVRVLLDHLGITANEVCAYLSYFQVYFTFPPLYM